MVPLDANVYSEFTVVVADSVAISLAADQFTAARWNANLNVNALWTAATIVTRIFHGDDLRNGTRCHFVKIFVLNIRIERLSDRLHE